MDRASFIENLESSSEPTAPPDAQPDTQPNVQPVTTEEPIATPPNPVTDPNKVEPSPAIKEVVKPEDSQPSAPSTSTEQPVESKPNEPSTDVSKAKESVIDLTVEDIDKTYQDKKANVQKRIDRLTAEKKAAQEQSSVYKDKIEQLEAKVKQLESPNTQSQDYSDEYLAQALAKAREDNDYALEIEITKNIQEREARKLQAEKDKANLEADAFKQKENEAWSLYVDYFPYQDDADMDLNSRESLLRQYMNKLYTDNPEHYNKFGHYRLIQVANDARSLILDSRLAKVTNNQTEALQRQLEKEKLKNEAGSGVSGLDTQTQTPKTPTIDDMLEERFAINRKSRLIQSA